MCAAAGCPVVVAAPGACAGVAVGLGLFVVAFGLAVAGLPSTGAGAVTGVRVMPTTSPLTACFCFVDDVVFGGRTDRPAGYRLRTNGHELTDRDILLAVEGLP